MLYRSTIKHHCCRQGESAKSCNLGGYLAISAFGYCCALAIFGLIRHEVREKGGWQSTGWILFGKLFL